jgi:hypothetical protein
MSVLATVSVILLCLLVRHCFNSNQKASTSTASKQAAAAEANEFVCIQHSDYSYRHDCVF